ncbi:MAG TPA: isoprenylcysteine carboxylmethyltransferase family protein [Terriglobales bacterium]|nr:isoprenylcysteine carboxylmethyltransferase family protein [Terriglobales bacterium]
MHGVNLLHTIGWLFCCIYASIPSFWLVIHPHADHWRQRHRERRPVYKLLLLLWELMWIALFGLTYPLREMRLYDQRWPWIVAVLFFATGIYLYMRARRGFSPLQFTGHHEIQLEQHEQRLVSSGIREHVRHPIYLGHLCEMIGWSVGTGVATCWTLTAFAIVTGAVMIRHEERELIQRFGDSYREYQQRVPAILPKF